LQLARNVRDSLDCRSASTASCTLSISSSQSTDAGDFNRNDAVQNHRNSISSVATAGSDTHTHNAPTRNSILQINRVGGWWPVHPTLQCFVHTCGTPNGCCDGGVQAEMATITHSGSTFNMMHAVFMKGLVREASVIICFPAQPLPLENARARVRLHNVTHYSRLTGTSNSIKKWQIQSIP
jgi:hypothetical protein